MNALTTRLNFANWQTRHKLLFAVLLPVLIGPVLTFIGLGLFGVNQVPLTGGTPTSDQAVLPALTSSGNVLLPFFIVLPGLILAGLMWLLLNATILRQINYIQEGIERVSGGNFSQRIPLVSRRDDLGRLSGSLNVLAGQLHTGNTAMEERIVQRTRDLEAARDIGQFASGIRDVSELANQSIGLIVDRFDSIYHAQVFLTDEQGINAVLQASTGEVGQKLLARHHRLAVGSQSVIGQVTSRGQYVLALDTERSQVHRVNELLPETRAELALPLRTTDAIIGALDLQSRTSEAFSAADIQLFQTMADQISIAIQNARLFELSNQRLREIEDLNQQLIGESWRNYQEVRRRKKPTLAVQDDDLTPLQKRAIMTGAVTEDVIADEVHFAVPVILRGRVLGAIEWVVARATYTENMRLLAVELAARFALAAENVRLLEETQTAASREHAISEIGSKLTQQSDVSRILQMAVRELGQLIPATQTTIRLTKDA